MVRKAKVQKMRYSYGFTGEHKIKPKGKCWNCGYNSSDDTKLKFIVNYDLEISDMMCPKCKALVRFCYEHLEDYVERGRLISPNETIRIIERDRAIRGK